MHGLPYRRDRSFTRIEHGTQFRLGQCEGQSTGRRVEGQAEIVHAAALGVDALKPDELALRVPQEQAPRDETEGRSLLAPLEPERRRRAVVGSREADQFEHVAVGKQLVRECKPRLHREGSRVAGKGVDSGHEDGMTNTQRTEDQPENSRYAA